MHELSVCQALLREVERLAVEHEARRVEQIVVRLGPLSGVEGHLLRQAYPIACAGTVAEQAELIVETVPIRVACTRCGAETDVEESNKLVCGQCGEWKTRLVAGDEMLLASVSMATGQAH